MDISIVVPCFNALGKIEACVKSLLAIDYPESLFEVIFVDDCSTDKTITYLQELCIKHNNWSVITLSRNTGSPSTPRNKGVDAARGKYVFFLDCDDEIFSDTLSICFENAEKFKADIIRGYLITDDGYQRKTANKISGDFNSLSKERKIKEIIRQQSTTVPSFIRRKLLVKNNIEWDATLRMGEDTIYLIDVLSAATNILYLDHPTFIYNKKINEEASSTQSYGSRELKNHLKVWQTAYDRLEPLGINYYIIRLQVGLQTALQSMIKYNKFDISLSDFDLLRNFIIENQKIIDNFNYNKRLKEILKTIYENDYSTFIETIKQRLVIAGYDLKFILTMVPSLKAFYQVKLDEWTGHNSHDEKNSTELLQWADIVFCEWMLGNAVWYSNRVNNDQKLFIRMHRFELTTKWYSQIDFRKVNRVFAVSVYFFEKLIEYTGIPRSLACLLPNYIDSNNYLRSENAGKLFNLGVIGILPSKKGYLKALTILKKLVEINDKYKLFVYGKKPSDFSWIKNDHAEMGYFNECEEYIKNNFLQKNVEVKGWVDVKTELKDVGFILSTSDKDELFESFHIAPADGFASGNQGLLLDWNGVEYIYPKKYIFNNIEDLVKHISSQKNISKFNEFKEDGFSLVENRYSLDNVILTLHKNIGLSTKRYNIAPFPLPPKNNIFTKPKSLNVVVAEIKDVELLSQGIEVNIPVDLRTKNRIGIKYTFDLPTNSTVNAALLSITTSADFIKGFNRSDIEEIGIYKYLETIDNNQSHFLYVDIPSGSQVEKITFKKWNKNINIFIKNINVFVE